MKTFFYKIYNMNVVTRLLLYTIFRFLNIIAYLTAFVASIFLVCLVFYLPFKYFGSEIAGLVSLISLLIFIMSVCWAYHDIEKEKEKQKLIQRRLSEN